ncbi:MAG: Excinuclease ABC C subunit domain protein [Parcubacteria group bacterium GW2011_GWA1_43_21]|nr:MAG: Excinuclease ABC C subunit domain protein [Parcubacteria group bacterium GW2011_GWB1_42_9]KKT08645.1 MAG: Excinuclease ABC C subunit domain protein [Parcubacteria group bacterium GW2011_GWA1_43_21]
MNIGDFRQNPPADRPKRTSKKYNLPDKPGIYQFKKGRQILYIGKATSLRDRVRSYFAGDLVESRGPRLIKMLAEANDLSWQETDSVLEALILESTLIKKHQPKYNAREKDDKSFNYIIITKEKWPRVLIVRGRDLNVRHRVAHISYGPFTSGKDLKIALNLIRKIFPFRDKCLPDSNKGCFNYQLGLCPGVCTGEISAKDYQKIISRLKMFFSGQSKKLRAKLKQEMMALAKKQEFEKADVLKRQLFALDHIRDVALIGARGEVIDSFQNPSSRVQVRIEAYDIAHLSGTNTVGGMVVWQDGELTPTEYRRFKIIGAKDKKVAIDDLANLAEILTRRLIHKEWPLPDVIVVDGDERQRQVAEKIFQSAGLEIKIIAVTKDRHHQMAKILGDSATIGDYHSAIVLINAEAHRYTLSFHRKLRRQMLK